MLWHGSRHGISTCISQNSYASVPASMSGWDRRSLLLTTIRQRSISTRRSPDWRGLSQTGGSLAALYEEQGRLEDSLHTIDDDDQDANKQIPMSFTSCRETSRSRRGYWRGWEGLADQTLCMRRVPTHRFFIGACSHSYRGTRVADVHGAGI